MNDSRVFRDTVHNYIRVEHLFIWQLINTREMQRLRRIHQLGGTFQVYPGAEHSRFTHSLGVYHVCCRMIQETPLNDYLDDYQKAVVMCAALLHDLGHGPYSHSFELIFPLNHESVTIDLILGDTEVNEVLSKYHQDLPKDVALVIAKKHPCSILVQMISSQLDCDRMDYLLRDSYYSGTTYGQFDLSRILRTLRIVDDQIVFKYSGVQAIENYILARYHMYWQVYYHPTARSFEQLLLSIFKRIEVLYADGFDFGDPLTYLVPFLENKWDNKDYIALDESVIQYYFLVLSHCDDAILSDLCTRILDRRLFKHCDIEDLSQIKPYQENARAHGFDPDYYIITDSQAQIPYQSYGTVGNINEIRILMDNREIKPLPEVSEIVDAIVHSKRHKTDLKVYYPKEMMNDR